MLGKRLIKSNDAGGGGTVCSSIVDSYNPFTTGGVALYQLNGDATDVSGNYDGTATNVTYSTGKFGQAGVFNGSSSKIELQTLTTGLSGSSPRSVSFWLNISATPSQAVSNVYSSGTNTSGQAFLVGVTNTMVLSVSYYNRNINTTTTLSTNTWYHIVALYKGGDVSSFSNTEIYINGNIQSLTDGGGTYTGIPNISDTNHSLGYAKLDNLYYLNGLLDQVRIFDRALNYTEVVDLYQEQVCVYACASDNPDIFQDGSGVALYQLNWDGSDSNGVYDGVAIDVSFVNGKIDSAGSFNGSSSRVDLPNTVIPNQSEKSISIWVNPNEHISEKGSALILAVYDQISIYYNTSNQFEFIGGRQSNSSYITFSNVARNPNQWYHIVISKTNSNILLYIDNTLIETVSYDGTILTQNYFNRIGENNVSSPFKFAFNGDIDQVRIFNKAISSSEVTTLYNEVACEKTCTTDDNQLVSDCIAYYKLDGNADDALNTYDGTPTNVSWTQGRLGSAGGFNGSSSYINTGITSSIIPSNSNFSVSSWINVTSFPTGGNQIFVDGSNDSWGGLGFSFVVTSNGSIAFSLANNGGSAGSSAVSANNVIENSVWYHALAVIDVGNEIRLYLNGQSVANTSIGSNSRNTIGSWQIGRDTSGSRWFHGSIDQVRIYDRAITAAEVTTLYNEVACPSGASFNTVLWTGDNVQGRAIGGVGFQPDFVWIKASSAAAYHCLSDTVRGSGKKLISNENLAERVNDYGGVSSFNNEGFSVNSVNGTDLGDVNYTGRNYVAWCWKAGGDAVTNTDGTITSEVSANQDAGFSIVSWTGIASTSAQTIGHGLSSAPELVILKNRDISDFWFVFANGVTSTSQVLKLDTTDAVASTTTLWGAGMTSTVVGIRPSSVAASSHNVIMYCFHSVDGFSKFGSYTGTGASGNVITTGFEPAFVMIKRSSSTGNWIIYDNKRDLQNPRTRVLYADDAYQEVPTPDVSLDILANGFEINGTSSGVNASGSTYIYMAFANQF